MTATHNLGPSTAISLCCAFIRVAREEPTYAVAG